MVREFDEWRGTVPRWLVSIGGPAERSQPHPEPIQPGGLPRGWTTRAVLREFQPEADLHLVCREGGGVGLLRHERDLHRTMRIFSMADNLVDLDTRLFERYPPGANEDQGLLGGVRDWVRGVLVALYDLADPEEAAEATLLALSGRVRTPPRAAY